MNTRPTAKLSYFHGFSLRRGIALEHERRLSSGFAMAYSPHPTLTHTESTIPLPTPSSRWRPLTKCYFGHHRLHPQRSRRQNIDDMEQPAKSNTSGASQTSTTRRHRREEHADISKPPSVCLLETVRTTWSQSLVRRHAHGARARSSARKEDRCRQARSVSKTARRHVTL